MESRKEFGEDGSAVVEITLKESDVWFGGKGFGGGGIDVACERYDVEFWLCWGVGVGSEGGRLSQPPLVFLLHL